MGCQSGHYDYHHCIKDTVRRIVKAQRKAVESDSVTCYTSCEQSIDDLLSPRPERRRPRHTTIPFMLVCQDGCDYFKRNGFVKRRDGGREYFDCIQSPVFKARGFADGSDNCVKLELLLPIRGGYPRSDADSGRKDDFDGKRSRPTSGNMSSPCDFFSGGRIYNFRETGVCITVDLDCFCGITCLDPITPEPR